MMADPSSGWLEGDRHHFPVRVYWENTDGGGIVYHAEYLRFAERARTEFLRLVGIGQEALMRDRGLTFAVASLSVDYRRPARLDDALVVMTRLESLGAASMVMAQEIRRDTEAITRLTVRVACLSRAAGGPARFPRDLRAQLTLPPPQTLSDD